MSLRAVFLDRDGTLNREVGFVRRPEDLQVLPGVRDALRRLRRLGLHPVVLTNQSGIARGLYTEADLARVHARLHRELDRLPLGYLHCPHHPEAGGPWGGRCECRKPSSGLLHQARELLHLEFAGSFVVGDSARDLLPARGLGMPTALVQTGKPWREELAALQRADSPPSAVLADLGAAAEWIEGLIRAAPTSGSASP